MTISGYNIFFRNKQFDYYTDNYVSSKFGTTGIKIPLLLSLKLLTTESMLRPRKVKCSLNMVLGLSYFIQPKGSFSTVLTTMTYDSIDVAQGVLMSVTDATFSLNNKSTLYTAGLSSEISYKSHKIANLSFYYQYGRMDLSSQAIDININNQTKYHYNVYSRGSAFVLQLSRNIYWNDINKKFRGNDNL